MENVKYYLNLALAEAKKAAKKGEIPIGAVIVKDGKIIAKAHNMRERKRSALCHAECLAIAKACRKLKNWRLTGCEMYVTLEPCQMCMGAIKNARISRLFFAAKSDNPTLNHNLVSNFVEFPDCSRLLKEFFSAKRQ